MTMRRVPVIRSSILVTVFVCLFSTLSERDGVRARRSSSAASRAVFAPVSDVLMEMPEDTDRKEMVLRIAVPECTVRESRENGRVFHTVSIPGYDNVGRAGAPRLPVKGYYLAVPEGAYVRIAAIEGETDIRPGISVAPAPRPVVRGDDSYIAGEFHIDASLYASDRLYPERSIEIGSYGYLRDVRVVQLRILPVLFNPRRHEIHVYRRMRVRIELVGGVFPEPHAFATDLAGHDTPFEAIYRNTILNYGPEIETTGRPRGHSAVGDGDLEYLDNNPCKVSIDEDGIYAITGRDLIDAGADPGSADPATIKLFTGGVETAVYVTGVGDGTFDPTDAVYFYGRENTSPFSRINVYWLSWGSRPGLRMESVPCTPGDSFPTTDAFIDTLHFEENTYYHASLLGEEEEDRWFWERLNAPITSEYPLSIPDVAPGSHDAHITVKMHGYTNKPHHVRISFNRYLGTECTWSGIVEHTTSFPVSSRYIGHETNKLVVECPTPGDSLDQVLFNWVDITYRRSCVARDGELRFHDPGGGPNQFEVTGFADGGIELFRITDPRRVERMIDHRVRDDGGIWTLVFEDTLNGSEYYVVSAGGVKKPADIVRDESSSLRSGANHADYIVITHPLFLDSVQELVTYRRSEGLGVYVATIDDVYDEFSYGNLDPAAIKDFAAHAYHYWQPPAPVYLLLVGDASRDYRGYISAASNNFVPTHLFYAEIENHETSSDDWFGCVAGDDFFPDMLVGRITARNEEDVAGYIEKVIAYETETGDGPWRKTAVLVADDPDTAGNFPKICDDLADDHFVPAGFDTIKIYYDRYYSACRQMIKSAIDDGCSFCTYFGHGSTDRWAREEMFVTRDIDDLNNATRYPLVVASTCKNGWFDHPTAAMRYSLAEEFSRAPWRGAVACLAYSGLSYAALTEMLTRYLYDGLLFDGNHILGSAACQAKLRYLALSLYRSQAEMLILLGDPALEMGFEPLPDLLVGAIDFRPPYPGEGNPDSLDAVIFNAGREDAAGAVVRFTHGHPDSAGSTLLGETTLAALPAGGHATASAVWDSVPGIGSYPIYVRVDPGGLITESCEWNNTDFDSLTVRPPCAPEDSLPPAVVLLVDGREVGTEFSDYEFTSRSPKIEAQIRDMESGIDIGALRITLNGAAVEDCEITHDGIGSSLVTVRYEPGRLADDTYEFRVRAADCGCAMNTAETVATFVVESDLVLRGVTNYPNPCRTGTCFRYSLSQPARDVTIRIYAATGALVQTIRCSPGDRNCNEFDWDGNGRHGKPLSSGVYFYRLTAVGEHGRTETHGKLVIVR